MRMLIALVLCCVSVDAAELINLGTGETIRGNDRPSVSCKNCLEAAYQNDLSEIRSRGVTGWKLVAELEARNSWFGADHALNPEEAEWLARQCNRDVVIVIQKIGDEPVRPPSHRRQIAIAADKRTQKQVVVWGR